jgi:AcrR family transcriptional regulator
MATRRTATPEPADLRQRILDTSRALLNEHGVAALSLREVARRAGVTHQAPYHHFTDRESILAELVTQGFDELTLRLAKANRMAASHSHLDMLVASGCAYVGFALDHPGVFGIMFRPDACDMTRFPSAVLAGQRARGELLELVRLIKGEPVDELLASVVWSQVHGLATLLLDGPLGMRLPSRAARMGFVRQAQLRFAQHLLTQVPAPTKA